MWDIWGGFISLTFIPDISTALMRPRRPKQYCLQLVIYIHIYTSYIVRPNLTCSSKNVIYLVSCKRCQLQYIGSTTTEFKVRFRNHKSSMITNKKSCEVAVHFNSTSHSLQDFSFQCIDQINDTNRQDDIDRLLITKEAYWSA